MAKAWKQRLRAWRTFGWLKSDAPLNGKARAKLEALDEVQLAAAAMNPGHSALAREAAQTLLQQRGGSLRAADIIVPGFVKSQPTEKLRRKFFGASRETRKWSGALSLLMLIAMFITAGVSIHYEDESLRQAYEKGVITSEEYFNYDRELTEHEFETVDPDLLETFPSQTRLKNILIDKAKDTPAGRKRRIAETTGYVFVGLGTASFLTWLIFSVFRRQPGRILLLRKFNNKKIGKAMANVISTELRPFGHVMTLSDKHIKRSRLAFLGNAIPTNFAHVALIIVWVPLRIVMRQFNRAKHGPAWVGSARNYRSLARRLRDRLGLNLEVAWTSKEAFVVRTSDDWWQEVIALLMHSADVIVVDLSEVTSGTQWELERIDKLKEWRRAVFTAKEEREDEARRELAKYDWEEPTLYLYDKLGDMQDQKAFRTAMLAAIDVHVNAPDRLNS